MHNTLALKPATDLRQSEAPARLRFAAERLTEHGTLALFQIERHFLEESHLLSGDQRLDPAMVLIAATVGVGTIERSMRDAATRRARGGDVPAPAIRPMSRRAIAVATGLPRETVRRRVKRLVELGILAEDNRGVTCADNLGPDKMSRIARLLAHQAAIANIFLAEGLFELESAHG
jgi:hypothetical protein